MSGGHFVDCSYPYHQVAQFASELEDALIKGKDNKWPEEALQRCKPYPEILRAIAELMLNFDFYWSYDRGDERFIECHDKAEAKLKALLSEMEKG